MYYFTSSRIDLYLNGANVPPTNSYTINRKLVIKDIGNNTAAYMPTYANNSGTNLFTNKRMYFTMSGMDTIDLNIAPVLYVTFGVPAITPDQFFQPANLISNFALLLGIDTAKIRNVQIVSAANNTAFSPTSRKRRGVADQITISLSIYDNPVDLLNDTVSHQSNKESQSLLGAVIINKFTTGQLEKASQDLFNVSLMSLNIKPALAGPNATSVEIGKINKLSVLRGASGCAAQVPCIIQPKLQLVDSNVSNCA